MGDRPAVEGRNVSEWQPIETAPKDGTLILGWWTIAGSAYAPHVVRFVADAPEGPNWFDDYGAPFSEPTHWMPLPPAPDSSATRAREEGET